MHKKASTTTTATAIRASVTWSSVLCIVYSKLQGRNAAAESYSVHTPAHRSPQGLMTTIP